MQTAIRPTQNDILTTFITYVKYDVCEFFIREAMMKLKSNPGGWLPIDAIVGRDGLVRGAWNILSRQSLLMTAERRIGKTCVLRKMEHEAPEDWLIVGRDLEGFHTAAEFATAVYEDVERHLSRWKRTANRARRLLQNLGGTDIGGLFKLPAGRQAPWKLLLIHSVEDLIAEQKDKRLVFFWDEMPFMLYNIRQREGETVAMEVLDVLRALRQQHANFRMVLTGSVGLHHVITSLKEHGYSNAPVNDMYMIEVPPLAPEDARALARALVEGERLGTTDLNSTVEAIALSADNIPFYIHHFVRHLKLNQVTASPDTVGKTVLELLVDTNDPLGLAHYRDRIATYYPGEQKLAVTALDVLATAAGPLGIDSILKQVSSLVEFDDRDRLLQLLKLLERDHYLSRDEDGYQWKFPLIARWWRLDRDLKGLEA